MPRLAGAAPSRLVGSQKPTHLLVPKYDYSRGPEAIELAGIVGVDLDPWQKQYLTDGLGVCLVPDPVVVRDPQLLARLAKKGLIRPDGLVERWAAMEVAIELSRQNGKSVVKEIRVLAGAFLFRERRIVYSAHSGETVMNAFNRIEEMIAGTPELSAEVKRVSRTNGKEGITLWSGQTIKFRTRTTGGGRGLDGDCLIGDEAQEADDDDLAAVFPLMSARPDPQIWYGGSAGGQGSVVLGRLVRRCEQGDPELVMYRWAADEDDDPNDPRTWAKVNPALGRRISVGYVARELRALGPAKFARERLAIGDYPREDGEDWVIPATRWEACTDEESAPVGPVVFSADAKPDQAWASIAIAGHRRGGRHVELTDHQRGTRWVGPRLLQLNADHDNLGVVIDPKGPLAFLIPELTELGLKVHTMTAQDVVDAFGWFYNAAVGDPPQVFHRGSPVLTSALASASTRKLLDRQAWRRQGSADISPIVAVTHAAHGLTMLGGKPKTPPARPRRANTARAVRRSETADLATASF